MAQQSMSSSPAFARRGRVGVVTFNRPQTWHALTQGDVEAIDAAMAAWERQADVDAILFRAAGRGFCAGGDLQSVYEARVQGKSDYSRRFIETCGRLNRRLALCRKPVIALLDGLTVGAGPGFALLPRFRVATEAYRFSVPGCGIGFVPEGGALWALSRAEAGIGEYLALTGRSIGAGDAAAFDLITDFVPSACLPALMETLAAAEDASPAALKRILQSFRAEAPPATSLPAIAALAGAFAQPGVERVFAVLAKEEGADAETARDALARNCPASLCAAFEGLRRGRDLGVEECLDLEDRLAERFLVRTDFYEGIRARLIDPVDPPAWLPGDIGCVGRDMLDGFFAAAPLGVTMAEGVDDGGSPV